MIGPNKLGIATFDGHSPPQQSQSTFIWIRRIHTHTRPALYKLGFYLLLSGRIPRMTPLHTRLRKRSIRSKGDNLFTTVKEVSMWNAFVPQNFLWLSTYAFISLVCWVSAVRQKVSIETNRYMQKKKTKKKLQRHVDSWNCHGDRHLHNYFIPPQNKTPPCLGWARGSL